MLFLRWTWRHYLQYNYRSLSLCVKIIICGLQIHYFLVSFSLCLYSQPLCSASSLWAQTPHLPCSPTRNHSMEMERAAVEVLVSQRKMNGLIIWWWFGFKESDDQQRNVFCRECQKPVATKGSSTTNLFHHLLQRHEVEYEEFVKIHAATKANKPLRSSVAK